jgi:protein-tyrosine phosphatase
VPQRGKKHNRQVGDRHHRREPEALRRLNGPVAEIVRTGRGIGVGEFANGVSRGASKRPALDVCYMDIKSLPAQTSGRRKRHALPTIENKNLGHGDMCGKADIIRCVLSNGIRATHPRVPVAVRVKGELQRIPRNPPPGLQMKRLIDSTGGRGAAVRFVVWRGLARIGVVRPRYKVDWKSARRLVFICSGNICRSPYAEALARRSGIPAVSFGVDARGNAPADPDAQEVALERGVGMREHVSISMSSFEVQSGDVFVALEPRHLKAARHLIRESGVQGTLLGVWCTVPAPYLPDPFGRSPDCFRFVFALIEDAIANIRNQVLGKG